MFFFSYFVVGVRVLPNWLIDSYRGGGVVAEIVRDLQKPARFSGGGSSINLSYHISRNRPDTKNLCYYPPPLNRAGFWRSRQIPPPPLNRDGFCRSRKMSATTPPPTESGRLLEITENFCYYPPPQSVVVPLLDYPLRIRPCEPHEIGFLCDRANNPL